MKLNHIKSKMKFSYGSYLILFILAGLLFTACSKDDEFVETDEKLGKQDAEINFEPDYFGQSFSSEPDSTHFFTITVKKGIKEAISFTVFEKIMSNGVIAQERTELPQFRQQLDGSDNEEISIEYWVKEERMNKDRITLDFVVEQEEDEISEAIVIEVEKEEPEEEPIQEINDIIYYTQLALGGQDNNEVGSYFNIETTTDYTLPEATNNQSSIDLAMLMGASTGVNFIAPASSGFQYFGSEIKDAVYNGWETKNDGEFVNIGNIGGAEEIFEELEYSSQIINAYEDAKAGIEDMPGYVSNENGPGDRIRQVNVGDVIFFKTESGTIAVLQITSILPDSAGLVEFKMKTAADPDAEPQEPGEGNEDMAYYEAVEMGGQENDEAGSYINIDSQTTYNLTEATENQAEISLAMLVGGSTGVNFIVPASSGFQYFGSDIKEAVYEGWDTKNDGQFVNLGNSGTDAVFEGLNSAEDLQEAFQTALAEVEDMDGYVANENGPGDRIRQVKLGDVIFFEAEGGAISVLKITHLAEDTSGKVIFELKTEN